MVKYVEILRLHAVILLRDSNRLLIRRHLICLLFDLS